MARAFLDYNATCLPRNAAKEAVAAAMMAPANASSVHTEGRAARALVEDARAQLAAQLGADPAAIFFTSGATESNATALAPELELEGKPVRCDVLILSAVEHPAVRAGGRFREDQIEYVPVDGSGVIELHALEEALEKHSNAGRRAFVSIMAANNETGVLQPLRAVADRVRAAKGVFHSDAVQVFGKIPFDIKESGADLVSITSHKLGGPQGVGALVARHPDTRVPAIMRGGGQERGRRQGTETVAGIAGFAAAATEAAQTLTPEGSRLATLRAKLEEGIRKVAPDAVIFGERAARLPNTTFFSAPGIDAQTALMLFDLDGVALSAGSACSSGKSAASPTLQAMGVTSEIGRGAMRVSTGWNTSDADVTQFLSVWSKVYTSLKKGGVRAA
ncbi:MAG TPA: cysteine desulfurase family protein [Xanthobacteraceae bacterium]|nr:cysteine desulfurase family protein [Xanthobacteraceae bacterium]